MAKNAALVLVGHGATRNPQSRNSVLRCAERLRVAGHFKEVHATFLKEPPWAAEALDMVTAHTVYVVPYFAYRGYIVDRVIPEAIQVGRSTGRRRVLFCEPVGDHPAAAAQAIGRLRGAMTANGLVRETTAALVIGHGTDRDPRSARATWRLAQKLVPLVAATPSAFLDQAPAIEDWPSLTDRPNVIVLPYLMAAGLHGGEDVPAQLGIGSKDQRLAAIEEKGIAGPFEIAGRRLWLLRPLGADPAMDAVVLARVEEQALTSA